MGYGYGYCCCGPPVCGQQAFTAGEVQSTEELVYSDGNADRWRYVDWSFTSPSYQLGYGDADEPAGSFWQTMTNKNRLGAKGFVFKFMVFPAIIGDGPSSLSTVKVGIFAVSSWVVWVDFDAQTLNFSSNTDAVGTIPETAELSYDIGFYPLEFHPAVAFFYDQETGLWNVQFQPQDYSFTDSWATLFQVDLGDFAADKIQWGATMGIGGGAIGTMSLSCVEGNTCTGCGNGIPMSFTHDIAAGGSIISAPSDFALYGCCDYWTLEPICLLDPEITQVVIGAYGSGEPILRDLHAQWISFVLYIGRSVDGTGHPPDRVYIAAQVSYFTNAFGDHTQINVAVWSCPYADFCCYGTSTFTRDLVTAGFTSWACLSDHWAYWQNYELPETITIAASGVTDSPPCRGVVVWQAAHTDGPLSPLAWYILYGDDPSNENKCADWNTNEPPFDPDYSGQFAYVIC